MVTINQLAEIVADIAGIKITIKHIPGPLGVRGRNSDNTRLREVLKWEPRLTLEEGLKRTYTWIEKQVAQKLGYGTEIADGFFDGFYGAQAVHQPAHQYHPAERHPVMGAAEGC
jgi:hypothetical protein